MVLRTAERHPTSSRRRSGVHELALFLRNHPGWPDEFKKRNFVRNRKRCFASGPEMLSQGRWPGKFKLIRQG
jgi:hypothetical protein